MPDRCFDWNVWERNNFGSHIVSYCTCRQRKRVNFPPSPSFGSIWRWNPSIPWWDGKHVQFTINYEKEKKIVSWHSWIGVCINAMLSTAYSMCLLLPLLLCDWLLNAFALSEINYYIHVRRLDVPRTVRVHLDRCEWLQFHYLKNVVVFVLQTFSMSLQFSTVHDEDVRSIRSIHRCLGPHKRLFRFHFVSHSFSSHSRCSWREKKCRAYELANLLCKLSFTQRTLFNDER